MLESRFQQVVSIAFSLHYILQYKLMNIFSIKCYFRANLKIDVTKNIIFWGISLSKWKSKIHSPGNFLLVVYCIAKMKIFRIFTENFRKFSEKLFFTPY